MENCLILRLIFLTTCVYAASLNLRPIIGILTQPPSSAMVEGEEKNYTSYIAASYVKFIESAGARVVPIWINKEPEYYQYIAAAVNGIIFPGGSSSIYSGSYATAGQLLYEEVLRRNGQGNFLPLWATCLGYEMVVYLSVGQIPFLTYCNASNIALPLNPLPDVVNARLFNQMPPSVYGILVTENVTSNFHMHCYTQADMELYGLDQDYYLLTDNLDRNNLRFISTIEHKTLPIFGVQWHPEKNAYEWKNTEKYSSIPHDPNAVYSVQYFADFFVQQARNSTQSFPTPEEEDALLIYNFDTKYTGNISSSFMQVYLFEDY